MVIALIDYYRTNSLAPYSPKMDITLGMPVTGSGWMQKQMMDEAEGIGRQVGGVHVFLSPHWEYWSNTS